MIEITITAIPANGYFMSVGLKRLCPASSNKNTEDPAINSDWLSPARASALPCPNRCSLSAGVRACRTAIKLIIEANASKTESTKVAKG